MRGTFWELLVRHGELRDQLTQLGAALDELWASCTKQTTSFDRVGGAGGGGDAKDGAYAAFADLRSKQEALQAEFEDADMALRRGLDALERTGRRGERHAVILRGKYLTQQDWKTTQRDLEARGFPSRSPRTVFLWYNAALRGAENFWEATHERTDT